MTATMRSILFDGDPGSVRPAEMPVPAPGRGQILVKVRACAVCRTDLHVIDGELPNPKRPVVPGHEVIGEVAALGAGIGHFRTSDRVGVPWLGWTCGECRYCREDRENLCDRAGFTGYTRDGGFAEYMVADERFAFPIPAAFAETEAAPLMCAGLIGYRALRMAGAAETLGLYGFGAAAHILAQVALHQGRTIYASTKPGDDKGQAFARNLGAAWAGDSETAPPGDMDAAIIFAPVGSLVPAALRHTRKGGRVVCAGIHMSDISSFPYRLLWEEREIRSVANLTRRDGEKFLQVAPDVPVTTTVHPYPLSAAGQALDDLRDGRFDGAAVLIP